MDRLWTPWRMEYIVDEKKTSGCLFCRVAKEKKDRTNLILLRTDHSYVVLNKFPYNNGHMMVVPGRHVGKIEDLTPPEVLDLFTTVQKCSKVLEKALGCHGINIGLNLGAVAGAGMPGHIHVHLVPRWQGDANFMPVIGRTKVLPESLAQSFQRLKKFFSAFQSGGTDVPAR